MQAYGKWNKIHHFGYGYIAHEGDVSFKMQVNTTNKDNA